MYMFPSPEKNRSIRFPGGRQSVEWSRLMLALALSVLAHAMVALPAIFTNSTRVGDGVSVAPHVAARLVGPRNGGFSEGAEHIQIASEKQIEAMDKQLQNHADVIPPDTTPPGTDNSPLSQKSPKLGLEVPEVRYFSSDLLTVRPYPLTHLESPDLRESVLNGNEGRVVLRVWVSDAGEVAATETEFTDMPTALSESIVAAWQRMRFMPGEIDGKAVGSVLRIEMTYEEFRLSAAE